MARIDDSWVNPIHDDKECHNGGHDHDDDNDRDDDDHADGDGDDDPDVVVVVDDDDGDAGIRWTKTTLAPRAMIFLAYVLTNLYSKRACWSQYLDYASLSWLDNQCSQ